MTFGSAWPDGIRLRRYESIDSTNEQARRLALAGERGPLWVIAAEQTRGRGRYGRVWVSRPGNLFATLIMEVEPQRSSEIGFVAGLAALDAANRFLVPDSAKLKWPNDVLASGRKLAGILVEQVSAGVIAAGIGMNLADHPQGATSIAAISGHAPQPEAVLSEIAQDMNGWLEVWRTGGFGPIRVAWLARAGGLGEPISAVTARDRLHGIFENLDFDGALVLRDRAGNSHRVTAADVCYGH